MHKRVATFYLLLRGIRVVLALWVDGGGVSSRDASVIAGENVGVQAQGIIERRSGGLKSVCLILPWQGHIRPWPGSEGVTSNHTLGQFGSEWYPEGLCLP